ncbi:MAG: flagellin [Cyanobacteria bacterium RYN_339]|nr:flagellin [Cyanobacteria bacterium RYN_339]
MSLRINTNVSAINSHRSLKANDLNLSRSLEKLSSGLRVNRAADDAAGLSISETMRTQVKGTSQAQKNAQDGINLLNVAEGGLNEIASILQRIRELAIQSANGTMTTSDRLEIMGEARELTFEAENIVNNTSYNGKNLLDGTFDPASLKYGGTPLTLQVGANFGQVVGFTILDSSAFDLGIAQDLNADDILTPNSFDTTPDLDDQINAQNWIGWIDPIISRVSANRAGIGTLTNRLEHTVSNLAVAHETQSAAESRIRDVDVAEETTTLTRQQILTQSATAMLSQANAQPNSLLSLFK